MVVLWKEPLLISFLFEALEISSIELHTVHYENTLHHYGLRFCRGNLLFNYNSKKKVLQIPRDSFECVRYNNCWENLRGRKLKLFTFMGKRKKKRRRWNLKRDLWIPRINLIFFCDFYKCLWGEVWYELLAKAWQNEGMKNFWWDKFLDFRYFCKWNHETNFVFWNQL